MFSHHTSQHTRQFAALLLALSLTLVLLWLVSGAISPASALVLDPSLVFTTPINSARPLAPNAILTVTNANDDGPGSLRQAIANATNGDVITFDNNRSIYLSSTLDITEQLTIDGGSNTITVSGDTGDDGTRDVQVLYIGSGNVVTLNHISIVSGTAEYGGGIYNAPGSTLTILNSTFSGNSAYYSGGGIASYDNSTVTMMSSTFANNSAASGGGAIFNYFGTVVVERSNLSHNLAHSGGGIESNGGALTVTHSILSNNSANYGGGIRNNDRSLTLEHSILSGNTVTGTGGGILNLGILTMNDVTLVGNAATSSGSMFYGVGGGIYSQGVLTIQNSTLTGNIATTGGGIYNTSGTAVVQNSTIYSNSVSTYGGGGIRNGAMLTLTNSTVSGNSAPDSGGGVYNTYGGFLNLFDSIIANNSGGDCINIDTVFAQDHNLIEDAAHACGLINGVNGNVTGQDPLLGQLADNGGSTWTMALMPGSPAIDAGNDAACPLTDQRGVSRPQGAHCDIGAYEGIYFHIHLPLILK